MGIYSNNAYNTGEKDFQLLLAAGLILRYETISQEDIYEKASKCFEGLLDIRDSLDTAKKISAMIDRQATAVQKSAETITDLLLFNKNNDPYLSIGFPGHAGKDEVNRRWKRLIVLNHPDRYPNQKEYEEKAKKLNEAYDKIRKTKEHAIPCRPINNILRNGLPKADTRHYARYLKYVPTIILALTIFFAVISVLLFLKTVKDDRHLYNKNQRELNKPSASAGLQFPALMQHAPANPCIMVSAQFL